MSILEGLNLSSITIESLSRWVRIVAISTMVTVLIRSKLLKYVLDLLREMFWTPSRVMQQMRKQGHSGPAMSLFKSNLADMREVVMTANQEPLYNSSSGSLSHDYGPRFNAFQTWKKLYGDKFIFKQGAMVCMHTADPEAIKEMFNNKNSEFSKSQGSTAAIDLMGTKGIVFADGENWAKQRKVLKPAFYPSKSKEMVAEIGSWVEAWLERLDDRVKANGGSIELDICPLLDDVLKDVLARSSFGIEYEKGMEGFEHQMRHKALVMQKLQQGVIFNPLKRLMPTVLEKEMRREGQEVIQCLREILQERRKRIQSGGVEFYGTDMLGLLIADRDRQLAEEGRPPGDKEMEDENIIDQCRTFFFAGHETVHSASSWSVVLLSHYVEWQERIRNEMKEVFEGNYPNGDQLAKLKQLEMFLQESLRLYSPIYGTHRKVAKDNAILRGEKLPKDLVIYINFLGMHHDKQYWGEDALEFNPERFANGVASAAKPPFAYEPFGIGPRICIAQWFALVEVKLVLAMLFRRFKISLSPSYHHEPVYRMMVQPKGGVQVVLELL